ncbi:MAG: NAD-dependent epimerase/dehydratase family protein [Nitrospinae bacterium]|nr:NAD-dependent epimerase/dehydratase family protein [Nitrospinota bacterium]
MNILVTGGAGFIGSHIARACLEAHHKVTVLDNLSAGSREAVPQGAAFYQMDLRDPEVLNVLKKEKIEAINHHAAQISVHQSVADPVFDANSNIIGTLQLLQNAVDCGVRKFVFASTGGAVYGEQDCFPAGEDHPCRPLTPYAIAKLCVEHYLAFYRRNFDLNYAVLRYSNVFGPGQNSHGEAGVVAIFCQRLNAGKPLVIFGDGGQTRDFISVQDVVKANLLALKPECLGTFNVGTGKETSVKALAESLVKLSGRNSKIEFAAPRHYEQRRSSIDYGKLNKSFGWKPELSLEEGLSETLDYFSNETH